MTLPQFSRSQRSKIGQICALVERGGGGGGGGDTVSW